MQISSIVSSLAILFCLAACSPAAAIPLEEPINVPESLTAVPPTQESFTDAFAYCDAVGQIDAPDAHYTGPKMTDSLFQAYLKAAGLESDQDFPDSIKQMTTWRCMDRKVYACNFGANIPCDSKADTDKTPTQAMLDFCKQFPDEEFIPMSVTGHAVIYSWRGASGAQEILEQIVTVDTAGYGANYWVPLEPAP